MRPPEPSGRSTDASPTASADQAPATLETGRAPTQAGPGPVHPASSDAQIPTPGSPPTSGTPALTPPEAVRDHITGVATGRLLVFAADWVHRWVESIQFFGLATVRRQMSIDFSLPRGPGWSAVAEMVGHAEADESDVYVPLTTLAKQKLAGFDLWEESGQRLPLLTTAQNGERAGAALVALARTVRQRQARQTGAAAALDTDSAAAGPSRRTPGRRHRRRAPADRRPARRPGPARPRLPA